MSDSDKSTNSKARLAWIERAAIENMKYHHICADNLAKDAASTLLLLLAGLGGAAAYAAKAIDVNAWTWFSFGASVFTCWLLLVCWYLVTRCLMATALPQVFNEPRNLHAPDIDFDRLRQMEINGMQIRIDKSAARNSELARHLNRARKLAIASPLVFIASSTAWQVVSRA